MRLGSLGSSAGLNLRLLLLLLCLELMQLLDLLHSQRRGSVLLELHALLVTCIAHPCQTIASGMAYAVQRVIYTKCVCSSYLLAQGIKAEA